MRHIDFSWMYLVRKQNGGSGGRCQICASEWGSQWHSEAEMVIGVDDEEWLSKDRRIARLYLDVGSRSFRSMGLYYG